MAWGGGAVIWALQAAWRMEWLSWVRIDLISWMWDWAWLESSGSPCTKLSFELGQGDAVRIRNQSWDLLKGMGNPIKLEKLTQHTCWLHPQVSRSQKLSQRGPEHPQYPLAFCVPLPYPCLHHSLGRGVKVMNGSFSPSSSPFHFCFAIPHKQMFPITIKADKVQGWNGASFGR